MTFMEKGHEVINILTPLLSTANKNDRTILHSQPHGAPLHPVEQPFLSDRNQIMSGIVGGSPWKTFSGVEITDLI